jgi:hypothetical protein
MLFGIFRQKQKLNLSTAEKENPPKSVQLCASKVGGPPPPPQEPLPYMSEGRGESTTSMKENVYI